MTEQNMAADWILQSTTEAELASRLKSYLVDESFNLPLWELCRDGGRPEVIEIALDHVTRKENAITANASVDFVEMVPASCGTRTNRNKSCTIEIQIAAGEICVSVQEELWDGLDRSGW